MKRSASNAGTDEVMMDNERSYIRGENAPTTFNRVTLELYGINIHEELIREWNTHDIRWFGTFLHKYHPNIFAHCVAYMKLTDQW